MRPIGSSPGLRFLLGLIEPAVHVAVVKSHELSLLSPHRELEGARSPYQGRWLERLSKTIHAEHTAQCLAGVLSAR